MKLSEIQDLIKFVAKSGVNEVELQTKDVKIVIRTKNGNAKPLEYVQAPATVPQAVVAPPAQASTPVAPQNISDKKSGADDTDDSKYLTIKSPMIGTFYRSSSPDKPAFVSVGDEVAPGKAVCIIEAMKLFNEIESEIKGKVVKILVNDATPVEYDQPLFIIDPS